MIKKYTTLFALVLLFNSVLPVMAEDKTENINSYQIKTYPLPGELDKVILFNSNSPEMVTTEGILLSTFPTEGKASPEDHLNRTLQGRFDIFTHHITPKVPGRTLYQAIIMKNPTDKEINVKVLTSTTYLTKNAGYNKLPDFVHNFGEVYAGPGDRASQDMLRNKNMTFYERNSVISIMPNETIEFMSVPLLGGNERTSQFRLDSDGPLYLAELAMYDKGFLFFKGPKPTLKDWIGVLEKDKRAEKRDHIPTPVDKPLEKGQSFIYSRVSGISTGSTWTANITNNGDKFVLPENEPQSVAYVLNTLHNNTLGTKQIQTSVMENRYNDTGYYSNGNYGVTYQITIPLYNSTKDRREVSLSFDTPIRLPENVEQTELSYYKAVPEKIAFRGEFKVEYDSYFGFKKEEYLHVVQRFGQKGENLVSLMLDPGEYRPVTVSYVYPADATAPHVLTITSSKDIVYPD